MLERKTCSSEDVLLNISSDLDGILGPVVHTVTTVNKSSSVSNLRTKAEMVLDGHAQQVILVGPVRIWTSSLPFEHVSSHCHDGTPVMDGTAIPCFSFSKASYSSNNSLAYALSRTWIPFQAIDSWRSFSLVYYRRMKMSAIAPETRDRQ